MDAPRVFVPRKRLAFCLSQTSAEAIVTRLLRTLASEHSPLGNSTIADKTRVHATRALNNEVEREERVQVLTHLLWEYVYPALMRQNSQIYKPHTTTGLQKILSGESVKAMTARDFEALVRWLDPDALVLIEWSGPIPASNTEPNATIRAGIIASQRALRCGDLNRAAASIEKLQRIIEGKHRVDIELNTAAECLVQISDYFVHAGDTQKEMQYAEQARHLCARSSGLSATTEVDVHSRYLFAVFHRQGREPFFRTYSVLDAKYDLRLTKPEAAAWRLLAEHTAARRPELAVDFADKFLNEVQMADFVSWSEIASAICRKDSRLLWPALEARLDLLGVSGMAGTKKVSRNCLDIASLWLRSLQLPDLHAFTRLARENLWNELSPS